MKFLRGGYLVKLHEGSMKDYPSLGEDDDFPWIFSSRDGGFEIAINEYYLDEEGDIDYKLLGYNFNDLITELIDRAPIEKMSKEAHKEFLEEVREILNGIEFAKNRLINFLENYVHVGSDSQKIPHNLKP